MLTSLVSVSKGKPSSEGRDFPERQLYLTGCPFLPTGRPGLKDALAGHMVVKF